MKRIDMRVLNAMSAIILAALLLLGLSAAKLRIETKTSQPSTNDPIRVIGQSLRKNSSPAADKERFWVQKGNQCMQQARSTLADSDYTRAETAYREALKLNPLSTPAMTGMAWVNGGRHEFEQSITWARKAITKQPENADAYGLWGDALVEMGDYDGAFDKYQRMLDLAPNLGSFSRGAHLLFLSGRRREAIGLMQKAIDSGGPHLENIAWCRAQLALMWWSQGDYDRAESLLEGALKHSPRNYHLLTAMARVQTSLGKYSSAIARYNQAIDIVPHPKAVVALGDLYRLVGRHRQAERQFALAEAIWRLKTETGRPHDILRAAFHANHDRNLRQALTEAQAVYRTRKNVVAADILAWCYFKNGRYAQARRMIGQALRLNTPDANILFHAGMIHARMGKVSMAVKYLRAALRLNPNFHPLLAARAAKTLHQLNYEDNDHG